ncbi:hypothetical protein [uncultured Limnobacter sp.]|jgi:hypothetical protein|uniref:hypothetical protein n=1 Tax=uncultured Limnobacter sp. TaxID=199681 RepID=UPI0032B219A4|tara:strand:+ start:992 stop:1147 length:156 start_codon:yes stop_codon:yes gene_type:complete
MRRIHRVELMRQTKSDKPKEKTTPEDQTPRPLGPLQAFFNTAKKVLKKRKN